MDVFFPYRAEPLGSDVQFLSLTCATVLLLLQSHFQVFFRHYSITENHMEYKKNVLKRKREKTKINAFPLRHEIVVSVERAANRQRSLGAGHLASRVASMSSVLPPVPSVRTEWTALLSTNMSPLKFFEHWLNYRHQHSLTLYYLVMLSNFSPTPVKTDQVVRIQ